MLPEIFQVAEMLRALSYVVCSAFFPEVVKDVLAWLK